MQTNIPEHILNTYEGHHAEQILRTCVHCGFCTATCPTYQLLGDELDGPRGRIYLMKKVFEGEKPTLKTLSHLDRCLTCRSCETTCPSGVEYARLLDLGRHFVETRTNRTLFDRIKRNALHWLLSSPKRFRRLYKFASKFDPLLPKAFKTGIHPAIEKETPSTKHERSVLLLQGCVQPTMAPNINIATQKVLDKLGINTIALDETECCGAISHHLNKQNHALKTIRRNIDAWWPYINNGCEAIISNASGCGITLKEYPQYLDHDAEYAEKASKISELVKDISEIITEQDAEKIRLPETIKVAFHAPCTLQHGLKLAPHVENLLSKLGCKLLPVNDSHLCCGSAGTYSILQSRLSQQLKLNKLANLQAHSPEYILTANIGCQHHLLSESKVPVMHWVEMVAKHL
jgi:glycolate oxidase iron-sulfur subunit